LEDVLLDYQKLQKQVNPGKSFLTVLLLWLDGQINLAV